MALAFAVLCCSVALLLSSEYVYSVRCFIIVGQGKYGCFSVQLQRGSLQVLRNMVGHICWVGAGEREIEQHFYFPFFPFFPLCCMSKLQMALHFQGKV